MTFIVNTYEMVVLYLAAVLLVSQVTTEHAKYNGHKVLKIMPQSLEDTKLVLQLVERFGLDVWHKHHHDGSIDVQTYPEVSEIVTRELHDLHVPFYTKTYDVQRLIDSSISKENKRSKVDNKCASHMMFTTYHSFEQIETILTENFASNGVGPSGEQILSELSSIGTTIEGKSIHMIKVYKPSTTAKKAIFVDGGIHAREWISPAFLLYLINQLKYNPSNSTAVENLVNSYDWYLVPVLNPDGYRYSWNSDRLWRKNRRDNAGSSCHGVDLNRNFGYNWNPDNGGSRDECAQTYSGVGAFSELESQAVRNVLTRGDIDFLSYLTIHSYGQMWLYPWGFTSALPEDVTDLDAAAGVAITALRRTYNTRYVKGSSTNVLYAAAGGSDDYAKGGACIKYSYTLELRDTGRYGFVLPENLITPTCEETMDAFIAFAEHLTTAPQTWNC